MRKHQTLSQAAAKYAARVEYRKRLTRIMARCACIRAEETEYDDMGQCTYPGRPSCSTMWRRDFDWMEITQYDGYRDLKYIGQEYPKDDPWIRHLDQCRDLRDGDVWCTRCNRRYRLRKARVSAYAAERNSLRALLSAAKREAKP